MAGGKVAIFNWGIKMTFKERNTLIDDAIVRYKVIHDRYTSSTRILTDDEWRRYINEMDTVAEEFKLTNMTCLSWALCQAFLDDTELMQKKLEEVANG